MSKPQSITPVIDRLETVLDKGNVPAPYDRWGARLLRHLTRPVQVLVTGLPRSGKTAVIEMITAKRVVGDFGSTPIIELGYGQQERAVFERADGSVTDFAGLLRDCDCPGDTIRARQELPDQSLIGQDFVELGLSGSFEDKQNALQRALGRSDVILWCTEAFGDEEQRLWAGVPDIVKDHSLLVITMADRQIMRGNLDQTIANLDPIVEEEFLGLYPLATIQGITARTSGDALNAELWHASGSKTLMHAVTNQIKLGRTADIDRGQMFLERLVARCPEILDDLDKKHGPVTALPKAESPASLRPNIVSAPAKAVELGDEMSGILNDAARFLCERAGKMLADIDQSGDVDPDHVLQECVEAMSALSGLLDSVNASDPVAREVSEDVQEGEEMLLLFQLERGEDAALDAVTLLLQMRKELINKAAI